MFSVFLYEEGALIQVIFKVFSIFKILLFI